MAKSPEQKLDRLLVLISTLVNYPGIGHSDTHDQQLLPVQQKMRETAKELNLNWKDNYPSIPTIRKDLKILREHGILHQSMYRWGYYLGTGVMTFEELTYALNALMSQAEYQQYPLSREINDRLIKRLRGLDRDQQEKIFYPVRQHINNTIVYTDPMEMMETSNNKNSLFHKLSNVEEAILMGKTIEISRTKDAYQQDNEGLQQIIPLQLIYNDIAWYLVYEIANDGHLVIGRIDRFADYYREITSTGRGIEKQKEQLKKVHKLLNNGWGLNLGKEVEKQRLELAGRLNFQTIKIRFYPKVTNFITEADKRHQSQKITTIKDDTGQVKYVDYQVKLPERSINEFMLWVYKFMDKAQVIEPPKLAEEHQEKAMAIVNRYRSPEG